MYICTCAHIHIYRVWSCEFCAVFPSLQNSSVRVYIHIYMFTYIYIYVYVCIYIHIYIYAYVSKALNCVLDFYRFKTCLLCIFVVHLASHESWVIGHESKTMSHDSWVMSHGSKTMSHESWVMSHVSKTMSHESWVLSLESWVKNYESWCMSLELRVMGRRVCIFIHLYIS